MNGAGGSENDPRLLDTNETAPGAERKARVEIYGPKGLREYVRSALTLTYTHLNDWYVVHELHFPTDTPSDPSANLYLKELPTGRNIPADASGLWHTFCRYPSSEFTLSAAPIHHSVPSLGYVLDESPLPGKIPADYAKRILAHKTELAKTSGYKNPMEFLRLLQSPECPADAELVLSDGTVLTRPPVRRGRRITVLGDTCDPSPIIPLAQGSDVLVHEATNAWLPGVDPETKETEDYGVVEARARERGHSTPEMAGRFARAVGVGEGAGDRRGVLVLNHFSSRYKDDLADGPGGRATMVMDGIRRCAERAWADAGAVGSALGGGDVEMGGRVVVCARDGCPIEVKA